MLALCWLIVRSWASFFHSGTPLARLLGVFLLTVDFFRVLGGSGSDVWASRDNFEGPKLLFLVFCRPRRSAMRKNCACAKTTVIPVFLYGFYILRAFSSRHITTQNHSRGLFNRASCKDCAPIPSGNGFWRGLALSGASLDRLLCALGRLLASLGHFLGVSWALLGRSWLSLGCSVELHGCISVPRTVPGLDFKGFGDVSD